MLRFTTEQLANAQASRDRERGVHVLIEHLRAHHPGFVDRFSDEDLETKVSASLRAARSFELFSKADVHAFVTLDMTTASGFYKDAKVQEILQDYNAPERTRMMELVLRLGTEDWARIYRPQSAER